MQVPKGSVDTAMHTSAKQFVMTTAQYAAPFIIIFLIRGINEERQRELPTMAAGRRDGAFKQRLTPSECRHHKRRLSRAFSTEAEFSGVTSRAGIAAAF